MKHLILVLLFLFNLSCANEYKYTKNSTKDYHIIPKPLSLQFMDGKFLVSSKTKIVGDYQLKNEGMFLAEILNSLTNYSIDFNTQGSGNIELRIDDSIENEEGYNLLVNYNKILVSGKSSKGIFYGIQSLFQLLPFSKESDKSKQNEITIPAVEIRDSPRYIYRGMHLDVARHMFPVSYIKKYIDLIALHKMNTFHWHLTDDQGWRIEIKKYPKLTQVGAWRNGTIIGHFPGTASDDKKYGGFYTQEEVLEIVDYATKRHVTIIPEIELPGHSSAAIAAYPSLSCFPDEPTVVANNMMSKASKEAQAKETVKIVQETWGVFPDVYCAGKDDTFVFLKNVLDEVILLFPSQYIHIGGDECPKDNWERCTDCQSRMKSENLQDEHQLQSYFIQRIEKYLNLKGKQIIGWDEILEGGLAPNATIMSWRGTKGGIEAARQGHDVIMTPYQSVYFDYYQHVDKDNEPLAIGGLTTVKDVYFYNPTPVELSKEEQKYILGAQANLWTEYISTIDYVEYMVLPRMTALSEVVWSIEEDRNWDDFSNRLLTFRKKLDALGLNYAKHTFISKD